MQRDDAAALFRLALEHAASSPGDAGAPARWHGAAESGIPYREVAAAIGEALDLPVRRVRTPTAARYFGAYLGYVSGDRPVSSERTRLELGWRPVGPGLVEDLETDDWYRLPR